MKLPSKILFGFLFFAILAGCPHSKVGGPAIIPAAAQRIFKAPYERVWNATLAVLTEDLGLPLDEVVTSTGLVSTKWITMNAKPGDFAEANRTAKGFEKAPMLLEYRIVVLVKISPEGTVVRARRYAREFRQNWYSVPTDLVFERQFLELVASRLGVPNP